MDHKTSTDIHYAPPAIVARDRIGALAKPVSDLLGTVSDARIKRNVTPVTWNDELDAGAGRI